MMWSNIVTRNIRRYGASPLTLGKIWRILATPGLNYPTTHKFITGISAIFRKNRSSAYHLSPSIVSKNTKQTKNNVALNLILQSYFIIYFLNLLRNHPSFSINLIFVTFPTYLLSISDTHCNQLMPASSNITLRRSEDSYSTKWEEIINQTHANYQVQPRSDNLIPAPFALFVGIIQSLLVEVR